MVSRRQKELEKYKSNKHPLPSDHPVLIKLKKLDKDHNASVANFEKQKKELAVALKKSARLRNVEE